jgi:hypothetical protein
MYRGGTQKLVYSQCGVVVDNWFESSNGDPSMVVNGKRHWHG